jgi:hypothetical protein
LQNNILTLKNQAPDFFHISRCSWQILHSQINSTDPPDPTDPAPTTADINDVIDEDLNI